MERFENLLDFINELNENGRIQYDDYSRLFDLVQEFAGAEEAINAAATDIAALLWLNGNCEYCEHGEKEEFSGANRWHCRLGNGIDCRPVWRGAATKPPCRRCTRQSRLCFVQSPAVRRLCSGRKRHGLSLIEQKSRRPRRRHTRGFCLFGAHSAGICEAFVSNSLSRLIGVRPAVEKRRCTISRRRTSAVSAGRASSIERTSKRTVSPTTAFPVVRRSTWPITRKLAPIRRCGDAHYHRSRQCSGRTGHWHKGADCSGFGAIRRYPCGVGRGSAANIPANADWRDCQPAGWQEEVRTDWGELLRRFRN